MDALTIVPFSFVGRGSFCKDFAGIVVDSNPSQLHGSANHLEQISGRLDAVFEITKLTFSLSFTVLLAIRQELFGQKWWDQSQ